MMLLSIILALLLLSACAATSAGPFPGAGGSATYMKRETGDLRHCVNNTTGASLLGGLVGGVMAGNAYADCKTALESMGYERMSEPLVPTRAGAASEAEKNFCRERANNVRGSGSFGGDSWQAEYWRCMAGY